MGMQALHTKVSCLILDGAWYPEHQWEWSPTKTNMQEEYGPIFFCFFLSKVGRKFLFALSPPIHFHFFRKQERNYEPDGRVEFRGDKREEENFIVL